MIQIHYDIMLFAEPLYSVSSLFVLYLSVNWGGSYTKYLTERAQRKAFLETRRYYSATSEIGKCV